MLENRYGHFGARGRVFSITDPRTPTPWVNVISNGRFGLVVSQNGGGFSWLDNSQLNVLTRWEMDLTRDAAGKYLYLADRESGEVWSLAPAPCHAPYDSYRCDHTQGSTTFTTQCHQIRTVWTLAVAPDDPVELWSVEITNQSERTRALRIASFFEWCCGVAPDTKREFHKLFITTRHDPERRAIFATKNMWDVPARTEAEHWNRPWPYVAAHAVCGLEFDLPFAVGDKATFMGRYGDAARPAGLMVDARDARGDMPVQSHRHATRGKDDSFGRFGDGAAALGGDLTLKPGQTVRLHYVLVAAATEAEAGALIDRYADAGRARRAIDSAEKAWEKRLSPTSVSTGQEDFDLLNNFWLPYQAISARLWARTGYYQQSGAFGFRDQLQDSQVWLPLEPGRCRDQILLHAAHQFADGSVYHWWHPLTETGLRTACSDDYLWLPFVVANYIKETGEYGVLDEVVRFVDDAAGATVLVHCERALARARKRTSARGLPLIGSCDWNDGLSALGVDEKGESVWLGMFLAGILKDFEHILSVRKGEAGGNGKAIGAKRGHGTQVGHGISLTSVGAGAELAAWRATLGAAIDAHAWDGEWYRCATRDDGRWIGTKDQAAGRIYLNCQTWAVLTDSVDPDRTERAWASAKEHLLRDMGPLLLAPAYEEPDATIGYITRYAPGLRENGGVYMHAATWALGAACKKKDVEAVGRIWRAISPPGRAAADAESYRAEPYVMPGNVDGPQSQYPGRAGWTWYTGSAAWLNRVCLEWVLGIRPVWGEGREPGLLIDPCPWPGLGKVDVTRVWRGRKVRVRFDAGGWRAKEPAALVVNGAAVGSNVLIASDHEKGGSIDVEVRWGSSENGIKTRPVRDRVGAVERNPR